MNHELDGLFARFTEIGVNFDHFGEQDLKLVEEEIKQDARIIWINDGINSNCHFINDAGVQFYFGIPSNYISDMGSKVYELMMHPDHFDDFYKAVNHWNQFPRKVYNTTFRVRKKNGEWSWTHSSSKALNFDDSGRPYYIISVIHDIEEAIHGSSRKDKRDFIEKNQHFFGELTKRELEILKLIAMEKTSEQIAEELSIKATTVNTHRKNMIRKLKVRSSLGLAKYYFLYVEKI